MKKLMIAAAAAALVTGAFAEVDPPACAYQVRFNLKSVDPVTVTCKGKLDGCALCGVTGSDSTVNYYRPCNRKLKAILARCLDCGESITNLNKFAFFLWEEANPQRISKSVSSEDLKVIQETAGNQLASHASAGWTVKQFGSRGQYVSVEGMIDQGFNSALPADYLDLQFKGFGEGRLVDGRIGQVSGSVIGTIYANKANDAYGSWFKPTAVCSAFEDLCAKDNNQQATVDNYIDADLTGKVPAYGYWTMRSVDGAKDYTVRELLGNGEDIIYPPANN